MIGAQTGFQPLTRPPRHSDDALAAARRLARQCHGDMPHLDHVARLALALFDQVAQRHQLGDDERGMLHAAAILHDIGELEGPKGHHKRSAQYILAAEQLPVPPRWRAIVAATARYHRKALPRLKHHCYSRLDPEDRARVHWLGGCLRLADGLDKGRRKLVRDLRAAFTPDALQLHCFCHDPHAAAERLGNLRKRDLLAETLGRPIRYTLHPIRIER